MRNVHEHEVAGVTVPRRWSVFSIIGMIVVAIVAVVIIYFAWVGWVKKGKPVPDVDVKTAAFVTSSLQAQTTPSPA